MYPCDKDPQVALIFSGKEFKFNPLDLKLTEIDSSGTVVDPFGLLAGTYKFTDLSQVYGWKNSPQGSLADIANDPGTAYCVSTLTGSNQAPIGNSDVSGWLIGADFLRNCTSHQLQLRSCARRHTDCVC